MLGVEVNMFTKVKNVANGPAPTITIKWNADIQINVDAAGTL